MLNQPRYIGAQILLARENFGCGSSREHAPWALGDGIRALIAPSFADIFRSNCMKNGLLPIVLDAGMVDRLFAEVFGTSGYRLSISLEKQEVKTPSGDVFHFDIDSAHKTRLLQGLDDIGLSLRHANAIRAYENARRQREPWIFS